ncbi:unnamed protein product [Bursaphelenchus okinawaensis]|uniref:SWIM-type domain-containing protein n=1 Tax=Bursaphelenchus okinawaensis TaxID=465554 RepID=A0A811K699_9BILA|nr:unnamed protein product [Bursaphelenchus okinawaensis]CAG9092398.1 unnamed protein product [Bursaphelenchus okinawaensis]
MNVNQAIEVELTLPTLIEQYLQYCVRDVTIQMSMKAKIRRIYKWTKVLGNLVVRNAMKIVANKRIAIFHDQNRKRQSFFKVGNEESWLPVNKIHLNSRHCNCAYFKDIVMKSSKGYLCQHLTALRIVHALNIAYYTTTKDLSTED